MILSVKYIPGIHNILYYTSYYPYRLCCIPTYIQIYFRIKVYSESVRIIIETIGNLNKI